jgi:hypothetical protein
LTFSNSLNPMEPAVAQPLASVLIDLGEHTNAKLLLDRLATMMPQHPGVLALCGINDFRQVNLTDAIGC